MRWVTHDFSELALRFGGSSSPPAVVNPGPAPTFQDPAIAQAQRDQAVAAAQAMGRGSTILTSGLGDTSAPTLAKKSLLGGS